MLSEATLFVSLTVVIYAWPNRLFSIKISTTGIKKCCEVLQVLIVQLLFAEYK